MHHADEKDSLPERAKRLSDALRDFSSNATLKSPELDRLLSREISQDYTQDILKTAALLKTIQAENPDALKVLFEHITTFKIDSSTDTSSDSSDATSNTSSSSKDSTPSSEHSGPQFAHMDSDTNYEHSGPHFVEVDFEDVNEIAPAGLSAYKRFIWAKSLLALSSHPSVLLSETPEEIEQKMALLTTSAQKKLVLAGLPKKSAIALMIQSPDYIESASPDLFAMLLLSKPSVTLKTLKEKLNPAQLETLLSPCFSNGIAIAKQLAALPETNQHLSFGAWLAQNPDLIEYINMPLLQQLLERPGISHEKNLLTYAHEDTLKTLMEACQAPDFFIDPPSPLKSTLYVACMENPTYLKYADEAFIKLIFEETSEPARLFQALSPDQQQVIRNGLLTASFLTLNQLQLLVHNPTLMREITTETIFNSLDKLSSSSQELYFNALVLPNQEALLKDLSIITLQRLLKHLTKDQLQKISQTIQPYFQTLTDYTQYLKSKDHNPHFFDVFVKTLPPNLLLKAETSLQQQFFEELDPYKCEIMAITIASAITTWSDFIKFSKLTRSLNLLLARANIALLLPQATFQEAISFANSLQLEQLSTVAPALKSHLHSLENILNVIKALRPFNLLIVNAMLYKDYIHKEAVLFRQAIQPALAALITPANVTKMVMRLDDALEDSKIKQALLDDPIIQTALQNRTFPQLIEDEKYFSHYGPKIPRLSDRLQQYSVDHPDAFATNPDFILGLNSLAWIGMGQLLKTFSPENLRLIIPTLKPFETPENFLELIQNIPFPYPAKMMLDALKPRITAFFNPNHPVASVERIIKNLPKEEPDKATYILSLCKEKIQHYVNRRTLCQAKRDAALLQDPNILSEHATLYPNIDVRGGKDTSQFSIAAHSLGLRGDKEEGFNTVLANKATKERFCAILAKVSADYSDNAAKETLPFDLAQDRKLLQKLNAIDHHGAMQGIHAQWHKHAFSFFLLKDQAKLHVIYVNRGRPHEHSEQTNPSLMIFTFDDTSELPQFKEALIAALKTGNRTIISDFIKNRLQPHYDIDLSAQMPKSKQKVGNCSIANANIAWHLTLTSRLMQKNPGLTFLQAYKDTQKTYKSMRLEDRAQAFCDLLCHGNDWMWDGKHSSDRPNLDQVTDKMVRKDLKKPDVHRVEFLLQRFKANAPALMLPLFWTLLTPQQDASPWHLYVNLTWAKALMALVDDALADPDTKKEMISAIERLETRVKKDRIEIEQEIHKLTPPVSHGHGPGR